MRVMTKAVVTQWHSNVNDYSRNSILEVTLRPVEGGQQPLFQSLTFNTGVSDSKELLAIVDESLKNRRVIKVIFEITKETF